MVCSRGSVSIDYRHADFGTQLVDTSPMYPGAREHQDYSEDSVRVSLNYRF
jgi:opacity protein-like surface antigen